MSSREVVLLEHLAATSWFAKRGEVVLTTALTFCLEKDNAAASAFVALIRERTGLSAEMLPDPDYWRAESREDDGSRMDVAGWTDSTEEPAPVIFVEAKVSAALGSGQVSSYVSSQRERLTRSGTSAGALVVLVPEGRVQAAGEEVATDLASLGAQGGEARWVVGDGPNVTVVVLSWDAALQAMLDGASSATSDLEQLSGACRALRGADVLAFTDADLAGGWQDRKDDLRLIIDRVTRAATTRLSLSLMPMQPTGSSGMEGGFRYLGTSDLPNIALGMRADGSSPPLWVRWHSQTTDAPIVEARLAGAGYSVQHHEGHLWLPLDLAADHGVATRQIDQLIAQTVEVYKIAVDWTDPI